MKDLSLLPNKEGFEFIAVLKNENIVKSKVIKDENGLHRFPEFSNSIGRLDLKIKAFRNKKTGSIDWRGNHELATIYGDNYYLKQPDLYEPIYDNI